MNASRATIVIATVVVVGSVLIAGCGSDGDAAPASTTARGSVSRTDPESTDPVSTDPVSTQPLSTTGTTDAPQGGWIGGEPEWTLPMQEDEYALSAAGGSADAAMPEAAAEGTDFTSAPGEVAPANNPLRAGSVDDNVQFDDYVAYRQRIAELGIPLRGGDPTGRVVVTVTGSDGHPVHGAVVTVTDPSGQEVAALTTTADGTVRFLPAMWSQPVDGSWTFGAGTSTTTASAGGTADLAVDQVGTVQAPVAL